MFWTNYHTHSHFCDGKEAPEVYVQEAIKKGFKALGFSGHSPLPFYTEWNIKYDNLLNYINEVKRLKNLYADKIEIYLGMEIDYIEGLTGIKSFKNFGLEYNIGSVHMLRTFSDGRFFNIDNTAELFKEGLEEIFGGDIRKLVEMYYNETCEMVINEKPTIVGHLDVVKKFNKNNRFFDETTDWYIEAIEQTLECIKQAGCIVEINTRGLFKQLTPNFYPSDWIIKRCRDLQIPLTINSDSHHPAELDSQMLKVVALLKSLDIKTVRVLLNNKWRDIAFNENGLIL